MFAPQPLDPAPAPALKAAESDRGPLDAIFACAVCSTTFSENYDGHTDTVKAFSDGVNPRNRLVTKLYLTSCLHVVCTSHFEGGAPPLFPAGHRAQAACPVCIKEKNDDKKRDLFSVRGFNEGEYDPAIPQAFFTVPPLKLEGGGKEKEALRFQYDALARFSQHVSKVNTRYNDALDGATENLKTTNAKLYAVQLSQHDLQAKVNKLEEENQELRRRDERLKSFEAKMPQITEYLNQFAAVVEDNKKLNRRLASVGMRMPTEPITLRRSVFTHDCYGSIVAHLPEASEAWQEARASSHTAGRSANISNAPDHSSDYSSPVLSQSRKRVRPDTPNPDYHPPTSRDAMPPPTHYIPRKQSLRSTFQSLKK
ncbi:hypothetical protein BS50DRAFT_499445, partial [Corynespora cassiicola Philippines]